MRATDLSARPEAMAGRRSVPVLRRGWWIVPSVLSGAAIWAVILRALSGLAGPG